MSTRRAPRLPRGLTLIELIMFIVIVSVAVVGILGAALYDPLWISAIGSPRDFALALTCFVALMSWRFPPWLVVLIAAAGGAILEVSSMS